MLSRFVSDVDVLDGFLGVVLGVGLLIGPTPFFYNCSLGSSERNESAKLNLELRKEEDNLFNHALINKKNYLTAKNSYSFDSNDKIIEKLQKQDVLDPFEQLAIEEIAFERELINHCPMHEKLITLKYHM